MKDFKNVSHVKIRSCPSTRKDCLACLFNFAEEASWAEFGQSLWGLLVDEVFMIKKIKLGLIIGVERQAF